MTMQLVLSDKDQATLIQLIDLAVKAGGLNVAAMAMPLALRIGALKPTEPPRGDDA